MSHSGVTCPVQRVRSMLTPFFHVSLAHDDDALDKTATAARAAFAAVA